MTQRLLRPPWFVLGCCGVLALVVAFETVPVSRDAPTAAVSSLTQRAAYKPPRFVVPPESRYREIAERPLFVPDRRPQSNPAPEQGTVANPQDFILEGVVLSPERRAAIIQYGKPPKHASVLEGTVVEGWHVEHIDEARVLLSAGGRTLALLMGKDRQDPSRAPKARP